MAIQRWNPWGELAEMERRMDEAMRYPIIMRRHPSFWWRVPSDEMAWLPPLEMYEKGDKIVVRAEIPGMKEEEIDISVEDNILTVKGEREAESEVKDEDYYRCELSYGRFSRSVALPSKVQAEKVDASYDNGILEITLPKVPEAKPKKIAVKAKKAKAKQTKAK
jgi:HSP20 family protein